MAERLKFRFLHEISEHGAENIRYITVALYSTVWGFEVRTYKTPEDIERAIVYYSKGYDDNFVHRWSKATKVINFMIIGKVG